MAANTVTFAVQLGSDGFDIAKAVAEQLGYAYYDWEVTSRASTAAGVSPALVEAAEHLKPGIGGLLELLFARSDTADDFEGPNAAMMETAITSLSSDAYRHFIEMVVIELSGRGEAVIVGHASQIVLRHSQGVLKVLVCGSKERRADRLAREENLTHDSALATVQRSDEERAAFFRKTYNVKLVDPSLYDLIVNTDVLSTSAAVQLIVSASEGLAGWLPEQGA